MKLYSGPVSLFTAKVRIALAEKQLVYERIEVAWSLADRYLPHHPDVVALNPKAEVPILVDGDLVVYDSTVILEYLDDRYPESALRPADPAGRARCRLLEAAADEIVFPFVWSLIEEGLYPSEDGGRDEDRLAAARKGLSEQQARLAEGLRDSDFLVGRFSVADIGTFVMLSAAATLGVPIDPALPHLADWFARVSQRPSVSEEMRAMQRCVAEQLAGAAQGG